MAGAPWRAACFAEAQRGFGGVAVAWQLERAQDANNIAFTVTFLPRQRLKPVVPMPQTRPQTTEQTTCHRFGLQDHLDLDDLVNKQ